MLTTVPKQKKPSTLYDVSRLSGVSTATVSRVFSGSARVSDEIRNRVLGAANELSYDAATRPALWPDERRTLLGAIFPEIASGFYADVLAGIDEIAAENNFDVLAAFVGKRRSRPELVNRLLRQGRADALLVLNLDDTPDLAAQDVEQLPIILIDREISGAQLPVVGMDNVGGAEAMIEHLFEQGHRRIGLLTGPKGNYDSEQRLLGCKKAFTRLGLPFDESLVWTGGFTMASGVDAAAELLNSKAQLPDAIFCFNDAMAIGMINKLHASGMSVPRDVAITGYDNVDAAEHLSLTSVACPMRLMGQMAAQWAVDLVNRNQKQVGHRVQVRLVVRQSSELKKKSAGRSEKLAN